MHGDKGVGPNTNQSAGDADRNLLFGLIALQNDFVTREQLLAAFAAWMHDPSHRLADILESQGALGPSQRELLQQLVEMFLARHQEATETDQEPVDAAATPPPGETPPGETPPGETPPGETPSGETPSGGTPLDDPHP